MTKSIHELAAPYALNAIKHKERKNTKSIIETALIVWKK